MTSYSLRICHPDRSLVSVECLAGRTDDEESEDQFADTVVMPEHVHLLISEPKGALLAKALQALKLSVAVQREERPFWQVRYYDFNVFTEKKRIEKIAIHAPQSGKTRIGGETV